MSEIAEVAKVSRPTLYGFYSNKDELLGGVVDHYNRLIIEAINSDLKGRDSLSEKLDVIFDHGVIRVFELMQAWPDAGDIVAEDNQLAIDAHADGMKKFEEVIRRILEPYENSIEKSGQTVSQYAEFVVDTATKLKKNLRSRDQLVSLLRSLKISILSVAGEL